MRTARAGTQLPQLLASPAKPSRTGIEMSIRTTSGSSDSASSTAWPPFLRERDDLEAVVGAEDRLQRLRKERMVVGDQDADLGHSLTVARFGH